MRGGGADRSQEVMFLLGINLFLPLLVQIGLRGAGGGLPVTVIVIATGAAMLAANLWRIRAGAGFRALYAAIAALNLLALVFLGSLSFLTGLGALLAMGVVPL